jgi:peptidoglycan hydrolase-like protein with peptidoglycan-binding domain
MFGRHRLTCTRAAPYPSRPAHSYKETAMAILKRGLAGEPVRRLQAKLGVPVDGEFGPNTETALKNWQKGKGLNADGIAGPDTFMAMGLYELILLKQGTRGDTVKKLQEKLGAGADGQFGPGTDKAVREYQQKNGLPVDGMAGPATLAHMKLFPEVTQATVAASQVSAGAATTGAGKGAAPPAPASATTGGLKSIWDTITSVFK